VKKLFVFFVLACLCSCGPPGTVVYEKVGSRWHAKEIHLQMQYINQNAIDSGAESLNEIGK